MRLAIVASVCVVLLAGCGSHPKSAAPSKADQEKALAGSPAALASVHKEGSQLLGGGSSAFKQRLASLKGHPVVVNVWGAWCGPCREEFPVFQKVSVDAGKRVAFLGVDVQDNDSSAKRFLKDFPVSYPSYSDPHLKIAQSLEAVGAFPTTLILDSRGKVANKHFGPYTSDAALAADIRRYAS